jgi:beta-phosphoglucomutase-like phosphatase (HAD superfamily)
MSAYILCRDITAVTPERLPAEVMGVSWDFENLLADFHGNEATAEDATLRPEVLRLMSDYALAGIRQGGITHNRSLEFVQAVQGQVQEAIQHPFPAFSKADDVSTRDKGQPGVFLDMADELDLAPEKMAHADDQWKSHRGARAAGYAYCILPKPWGEHQHPGVRLSRLVETPIIRPYIRYVRPGTIVMG